MLTLLGLRIVSAVFAPVRLLSLWWVVTFAMCLSLHEIDAAGMDVDPRVCGIRAEHSEERDPDPPVDGGPGRQRAAVEDLISGQVQIVEGGDPGVAVPHMNIADGSLGTAGEKEHGRVDPLPDVGHDDRCRDGQVKPGLASGTADLAAESDAPDGQGRALALKAMAVNPHGLRDGQIGRAHV